MSKVTESDSYYNSLEEMSTQDLLININKDKVLDEKRDYDNKVFRTGGFRSLYGLYVLFSEN